MRPHGKGGRPPLPPDSVRNRNITVKFSGEEFSRIQTAAEKTKMPLSVFIREMALRGKVTGRVSEEEKSIVDGLRMNLRNIGININIIVRQASAGITPSMKRDLFGLLGRIGSLADEYEEKLHHHGWGHL